VRLITVYACAQGREMLPRLHSVTVYWRYKKTALDFAVGGLLNQVKSIEFDPIDYPPLIVVLFI